MRVLVGLLSIAVVAACSSDESGKAATNKPGPVCTNDGSVACSCTPGSNASGKCAAASFAGGTAICCASPDWKKDAPTTGSCTCTQLRCVQETGGCRCGLGLLGVESGTCTTSSGVCCSKPTGECYCKYPSPPVCGADETQVTLCSRQPVLKCPGDQVETPVCGG